MTFFLSSVSVIKLNFLTHTVIKLGTCLSFKGSRGLKILMENLEVSELPQTSIPDSCLRGRFHMISDNTGIF